MIVYGKRTSTSVNASSEDVQCCADSNPEDTECSTASNPEENSDVDLEAGRTEDSTSSNPEGSGTIDSAHASGKSAERNSFALTVCDAGGNVLCTCHVSSSARVADLKDSLQNELSCICPIYQQVLLMQSGRRLDHVRSIEGLSLDGAEEIKLTLCQLPAHIGEWMEKTRHLAGNSMEEAFRTAEDEIRSCFECCLKAVARSATAFKLVSTDLQQDPEFIMQAISVNGNVLELVAAKFQDDEEMVKVAILSSPLCIRFASERVKSSHTLSKMAISLDGDALQHVAPGLQDNYGMVLAAVENKPSSLAYASRRRRCDPRLVFRSKFETRLPFSGYPLLCFVLACFVLSCLAFAIISNAGYFLVLLLILVFVLLAGIFCYVAGAPIACCVACNSIDSSTCCCCCCPLCKCGGDIFCFKLGAALFTFIGALWHPWGYGPDSVFGYIFYHFDITATSVTARLSGMILGGLVTFVWAGLVFWIRRREQRD